MNPKIARDIINNFCLEYCDGQTDFVINGVTKNSDNITDQEAIEAAQKVANIMLRLSIEERRTATLQ